MRRFPVDVPKSQAIKTLEKLGFRVIREGNHISMIRENLDGSRTPLTMPNHRRIKGSTLRLYAAFVISRGFLEMIF